MYSAVREGSLFRVFLHFFLCKRSCDDVKDYCSICSHVRQRNFQKLTLFDDFLLSEREFDSQLGLDDETVDYDVFLPNYIFESKSSFNMGGCGREMTIDYASDIYISFVSVFIRINLNLCYDFFLKKPLSISNEKYFIKRIQEFVRDLSNEIWYLNVNYFFVIFDEFVNLNRSICYFVTDIKPAKGLYKSRPKLRHYSSGLPVVSTSASNSDYSNSDSN